MQTSFWTQPPLFDASLFTFKPQGGTEILDALAVAIPITDLSPPSFANDPRFLLSTQEKEQRAKDSIEHVLRSGRPLSVAYSGGKDSTVCLSLVLSVAADMKKQGFSLPPIMVSHANTGIENPAYQTVVDSEIEKIKRYAQEHDLPVRVDIARPSLNDSWAVRIISGRALPTFPDSPNRDCSVTWKVQPQQKQKKAIMKVLANTGRPVVVLGTRFDESTSRATRMSERGEDDGVWEHEVRDAAGKLVSLEERLSPIAYWGQEDVWAYLSGLTASKDASYTDAQQIWDAYRDGGGTSCAVVSDDALKANAKGCGARFGCSLCVASSRDKSLEAMLESDPKYAYLIQLNKLQRFLSNTQYDLTRRSWLGRSITDDGYCAVGPDSYGPDMQKELLRYAMTIDRDEDRAAHALGIEPRFRLVSDVQMVAIDALWSIQGYHQRPFEAVRIWKEVWADGKSYYPPEIDASQFEKKVPKPRYLYVGQSWESTANLASEYAGLRDLRADFASTFETEGCIGHKTLADGRTIMDIRQSSLFDIDPEAVGLFLGFEVLDGGILNKYEDHPDPTEGFRYYGRLGLVSTGVQHMGTIDEIMARTSWKRSVGVFELSPQELLNRSVSSEERKQGLKIPNGSLSIHAEDVPLVTQGCYQGLVYDVTPDHIIQHVGRDNHVAHSRSLFPDLPAIGQSIQVAYNGGATLISKLTKKPLDLGVSR